MTAKELAEEFYENTSKVENYKKAMGLLHESGFESVLRRLGEPSDLSLEHPNHLAISAFEQAERRGWYKALDFVFNFFGMMMAEGEKQEVGDFGAGEKLKELGLEEFADATRRN